MLTRIIYLMFSLFLLSCNEVNGKAEARVYLIPCPSEIKNEFLSEDETNRMFLLGNQDFLYTMVSLENGIYKYCRHYTFSRMGSELREKINPKASIVRAGSRLIFKVPQNKKCYLLIYNEVQKKWRISEIKITEEYKKLKNVVYVPKFDSLPDFDISKLKNEFVE